MSWKTPNGCWLRPGDEVVYIKDEGGGYDWAFTGKVVECLPVNDDDDGEIRISWHNNDGPIVTTSGTGIIMPRTWYCPTWVEKIESINALDRLAGES